MFGIKVFYFSINDPTFFSNGYGTRRSINRFYIHIFSLKIKCMTSCTTTYIKHSSVGIPNTGGAALVNVHGVGNVPFYQITQFGA